MRLVLSFTALALALAGAASAQTSPPRSMLSDACRAEVMKLCPRTGDRDARRACIMASRDKLSADCQKEMAVLRATRQGARSNGDMAAPGAMTTNPQPAPKQ